MNGVPAVCEPIALVPPESVTANDANAPGATVNVAAVPALTPDALAVIVLFAPAAVGVITTPSTNPPVVIVAVIDPANALDVNVTAPVNEEFVLPFASTAETRIAAGKPATSEDNAVSEPDTVAANPVTVPAAPVAVITVDTAAEPVPTLAVSVFTPAVVPKVHAGTVASPEEFVVAVDAASEPPPEATEKFTVAASTGLPSTSSTSTVTGEPSALPAVADCPPPEATVIDAGADAVNVTAAVAVNDWELISAETVAFAACVGAVNTAL